MKTVTFSLATEESRAHCLDLITKLEIGGETEVVIRKKSASKTMQQLGALFGLWSRHLVDLTGYEAQELHRWHKRKFLEPIYRREPMNDSQTAWLESILYWFEKGRGHEDKVDRRRRMISLSWATKEQMSEYMGAIDAYYISKDMPLPVPGEYEAVWKR